MGEGPTDDRPMAATAYRLPTDGDHRLALTIFPAVGIGLFASLVAGKDDVGRRPGLDLPLGVAIAIGLAVAVVAAAVLALSMRRAPQELNLRVGRDGIALTEGPTERWSIPWSEMRSLGIVHSALPSSRYQPAPSYLRLELAGDAAPLDPSLHRHDGALWFALFGFDTAARLHRDLVHRVPDRARSVETEARLPTHLATYGRTPRKQR